MVVRGGQPKEESILKLAKVILLTALAAEHETKILRTGPSKAFFVWSHRKGVQGGDRNSDIYLTP